MKTTALLLALVNSPCLEKETGTFRLESDEKWFGSKTDQIWDYFRASHFQFVNMNKLLHGTYIWAYNAEEQLGTQFYNLRDLSFIDENGTEISLYYIGK